MSKTEISQDLRSRYDANKDNKDSAKILREQISAIDKDQEGRLSG